MPIRSHLGRSMDFRAPFNVAVMAAVAVAAGAALVMWLNSGETTLLLAPVHVFLVWALLREVDPEHNWTALVGGVAAGAWVLAGMPHLAALAVAGLMLAARIVTETTGRRPLPVDLAFVTVAGIVIAFTIGGWVAGFGIAIALYLDGRLSGATRGMQIAASALTAVGATVVAAAAQAFPQTLPDIELYAVIPAGLIAVLLVIREPAQPKCRVDARHASLIRADRLHISRSLIGVLVFAIVLLAGDDAAGLIPVVTALLLAVVANEVERLSRAGH